MKKTLTAAMILMASTAAAEIQPWQRETLMSLRIAIKGAEECEIAFDPRAPALMLQIAPALQGVTEAEARQAVYDADDTYYEVRASFGDDLIEFCAIMGNLIATHLPEGLTTTG